MTTMEEMMLLPFEKTNCRVCNKETALCTTNGMCSECFELYIKLSILITNNQEAASKWQNAKTKVSGK